MVVIYHMDRFVWILGAVWTVGGYVGLASLVSIDQIHEGCEFLWACLNHPGARPNHNAILAAHKLWEEWTVVDWYFLIIGSFCSIWVMMASSWGE